MKESLVYFKEFLMFSNSNEFFISFSFSFSFETFEHSYHLCFFSSHSWHSLNRCSEDRCLFLFFLSSRFFCCWSSRSSRSSLSSFFNFLFFLISSLWFSRSLRSFLRWLSSSRAKLIFSVMMWWCSFCLRFWKMIFCKIDVVDYQSAILSVYIWKTWNAINL